MSDKAWSCFFIILLLHSFAFGDSLRNSQPQQKNLQESFVTAKFCGGLGNLMFQVAAACGIAWENGATPSFSGLKMVDTKYQKGVFSRLDKRLPSKIRSSTFLLSENTIKKQGFFQYVPNMMIEGYFQSLHYFVHHQEKLKQLFAPTASDLKYLKKKYAHILKQKNLVGIQVRYYHDGSKTGSQFIQYGRDYLEKAIALFPQDAFFVVSSNNLSFTKKCLSNMARNFFYIQREQDYLEMYLLSMCEHNIITNSSFGFWGAWLNEAPHKKVVRPMIWVGAEKRAYMTPQDWISVDAKFNE